VVASIVNVGFTIWQVIDLFWSCIMGNPRRISGATAARCTRNRRSERGPWYVWSCGRV